MIKILVTGAGAVLGQGILRCLQGQKDYILHTADPDIRSAGHWLGNKAHTIKLANDPEYLLEIDRIISEEQIDIVLIGTDTELPIFAKNKAAMERKFPVKIVVSSEEVINIANDKFLTAEFLKGNGFEYPESYMTYDANGMNTLKTKANYPYISKPVDGARSKGIVVIQKESDLDEITSYKNNLVVQEFLTEEEGEFTSGCLVFGGKCTAVVTLRRDLRDGNTYRAYYKNDFDRYNEYIAMVAEKLGVEGPSNFQFRIRNGKPVIFEVNSRFSGTTPLRSFFGFNEVLATVEYYLDLKIVKRSNLKNGVVMRVWADIFVDEDQMNYFKENGSLGNPKTIYFPFKSK
jgi:carbamoyl-phosphate synthase large subunit